MKPKSKSKAKGKAKIHNDTKDELGSKLDY